MCGISLAVKRFQTYANNNRRFRISGTVIQASRIFWATEAPIDGESARMLRSEECPCSAKKEHESIEECFDVYSAVSHELVLPQTLSRRPTHLRRMG